jgi:hypothetical protein
MGVFRSLFIMTVGAALGGALLLAHRVSQETGKSMTEAFADIPSEAQKLFADLRWRTDNAVSRGREAYHEKQTEMEDHLQGANRPD